MLQREFRHVHCPFSPVSKTAVRKPLVFSSTFLFSLGKGRKPVLFLQNPLHRWAQTYTAKWHIAACQGLMQHFTSRFEQLQRKPPEQWPLSQSAGFTPGSLHSVFHRLWRGSSLPGAGSLHTKLCHILLQEQLPRIGSFLVLPIPARASSDSCSSHSIWVPTPRLASKT